MKTQIPAPDTTAAAASQTLSHLISQEIHKNDNWISFAKFMELSLYYPQYGYYTGGTQKFGNAGDFITAPTLSPLFGATLAKQLNALLPETAGNIYEFGAGTGALAASILQNLAPNSLNHYYIIELSPELAQRQQQYIQQHTPQHASKVVHLQQLPESFDGILLGNEVLDAMPIEVVQFSDGQFHHMGVSLDTQQQFQWQARPLHNPALLQAAATYFPQTSEPYTSELHLTQHAFICTLAEKLMRGAIIMIDYGFDAAQYYHPQRNMGTLIGHYRHHTIHDPFFHIGLTDLTAHVNFTDIAQAGVNAELDLIGYITQANFLLNLGITEILAKQAEPDSEAYIKGAAAIHKLVGQHEMGELFKVIAFGKDINVDWQGFSIGDICHKL